MNTPSHLIITAALRKRVRPAPIPTSAVLWGSIAPDLPLYLLSIGGLLYYRFFLGWDARTASRFMYDDLFFNSPFWLVPHNLLHAPIMLLIGMALLWSRRRQIAGPFRWLFWFLASCMLHTIIDILCHVDDGPLLFFPFNWTYRFHSLISYWDPRYYGVQFTVFELTLDVVLLGYLLVPRLLRWLKQRAGRGAASNAQ